MPVPSFHIVEFHAAREDVDQLGHVSNIRYVDWLQRAAQGHSAAMGFDVRAYREIGGIFVVRRHEIDYLRPAFAGELIRLHTQLEDCKLASSVRVTEILRVADAEGRAEETPVVLARGRTKWAFVDWDTGRPTSEPSSQNTCRVCSRS